MIFLRSLAGRYATVAFILISLAPVAGMAAEEEKPDERSTEEAMLLEGSEAMRVAIGLARAAMEKGDFARSLNILDRVVSSPLFSGLPAADRVAALFALGQTQNSLGNHWEAVRIYRRILVLYPGLVRVRLELARSLFLVRDDKVAAYHFRYALAGDLPETVDAKVRRYLYEIKKRRRWSLDVSVGAVGNSNVNVAPTIREIEIFGFPAELSEDARKKSSFGFATFIGGDFRQPVAENVQIRAGGHFENTLYDDSEFNDTTAAAFAGPHFLFETDLLGDSGVSLFLLGFRRWFGGEEFSRGLGPAVEFSAEPTDRFRLKARVDHLNVRYDDRHDYDGTLTTATVRPAFVLSPTSLMTATLGVAYDRTDEEGFRNWQYRIGLGYQKDLAFGFTIAVQPDYRYVSYEKEWPAFGGRRRDHVYQVRTNVLNRRLEVFGFTPVIGYRYQYRDSTIDLYNYDQHRGELSFTRRF